MKGKVKVGVKRTVDKWAKLDMEGRLPSWHTLLGLTKDEVQYCGGDCDNCCIDWCPHNITEK